MLKFVVAAVYFVIVFCEPTVLEEETNNTLVTEVSKVVTDPTITEEYLIINETSTKEDSDVIVYSDNGNNTKEDILNNNVSSTNSSTFSTTTHFNTTITSTSRITTTIKTSTTTIAVINSTSSTISSSLETSEFTTFPSKNVTSTNESSPVLSFNLNYLYLLLIIVPVFGFLIGGYCYFKKRRKKQGYVEPQVQKARRFSTPSWVFSEPDFHDEEVTTLEEEKK